jgi:cell division protein FtsQ
VHRALEKFPLIQRYSIERIPPHTLIVRIEERVAVIALERESGFELLDAAGVLLGRVDERPAGVPLGSAAMADTSSAGFIAAATVVRDMPDDIRQQLVSVDASSAQDVTFVLSNGAEVVWGEADETQRKAVVLRALLASIGAPTQIDVTVPDAPVFK